MNKSVRAYIELSSTQQPMKPIWIIFWFSIRMFPGFLYTNIIWWRIKWLRFSCRSCRYIGGLLVHFGSTIWPSSSTFIGSWSTSGSWWNRTWSSASTPTWADWWIDWHPVTQSGTRSSWWGTVIVKYTVLVLLQNRFLRFHTFKSLSWIRNDVTEHSLLHLKCYNRIHQSYFLIHCPIQLSSLQDQRNIAWNKNERLFGRSIWQCLWFLV